MNVPLRFSLLLIVILSACTPGPATVPTSTPDGFISSSIEVVDKFYTKINDAQTETDLLNAYNMLTTEAMCNGRIVPYCDASKFQAKWWNLKVAYKLYDCGNNVVISDETRFPRSDSSPSTPAAPKFWRYKLVQVEESLLIDDISVVQSLDGGCQLALDKSARP